MWFNAENVAIYRVYDGDKIEVDVYEMQTIYG